MFLINNLILYKGEKMKCNIVSRFNKLHKLFKEDYVYDCNMDVCPLIIKKIFTVKIVFAHNPLQHVKKGEG